MNIQETIKKAHEDRAPVTIYYNDEAGVWQWAVALVDDPEFWLNAFSQKEDALAYCKEHKLPVTDVIENKT